MGDGGYLDPESGGKLFSAQSLPNGTVTTNDAAVHPILSLPNSFFPDDKSTIIGVLITANENGVNAAGYLRVTTVRKAGGVITLVATNSVVTSESNAAWDVIVGLIAGVEYNAVGAAAVNIVWNAAVIFMLSAP